MADHCCFCDTRRPEGGTNHLVLNQGQLWLEFCPQCGQDEILTSADGEEITVQALFDRTQGDEDVVSEAINRVEGEI